MSDEKRVERKLVLKALEEVDRRVVALSRAGLKEREAVSDQHSAFSCGEQYFRPGVLKKMDKIYHDIFDRHKEPERMLEVPAVTFF